MRKWEFHVMKFVMLVIPVISRGLIRLMSHWILATSPSLMEGNQKWMSQQPMAVACGCSLWRLCQEVVSVMTSQSCGFEGVSFNNFVDVMTFPIRDGETRDEDAI
jgi:hypothetical protein